MRHSVLPENFKRLHAFGFTVPSLTSQRRHNQKACWRAPFANYVLRLAIYAMRHNRAADSSMNKRQRISRDLHNCQKSQFGNPTRCARAVKRGS